MLLAIDNCYDPIQAPVQSFHPSPTGTHFPARAGLQLCRLCWITKIETQGPIPTSLISSTLPPTWFRFLYNNPTSRHRRFQRGILDTSLPVPTVRMLTGKLSSPTDTLHRESFALLPTVSISSLVLWFSKPILMFALFHDAVQSRTTPPLPALSRPMATISTVVYPVAQLGGSLRNRAVPNYQDHPKNIMRHVYTLSYPSCTRLP